MYLNNSFQNRNSMNCIAADFCNFNDDFCILKSFCVNFNTFYLHKFRNMGITTKGVGSCIRQVI